MSSGMLGQCCSHSGTSSLLIHSAVGHAPLQAAGRPGGAGGAAAGQAPGSPGDGGEVTEEQLRESEEEGAASIVEVYAALLAGFVAEGDPALRQARSRRLRICPCCIASSASCSGSLHAGGYQTVIAHPVHGPARRCWPAASRRGTRAAPGARCWNTLRACPCQAVPVSRAKAVREQVLGSPDSASLSPPCTFGEVLLEG